MWTPGLGCWGREGEGRPQRGAAGLKGTLRVCVGDSSQRLSPGAREPGPSASFDRTPHPRPSVPATSPHLSPQPWGTELSRPGLPNRRPAIRDSGVLALIPVSSRYWKCSGWGTGSRPHWTEATVTKWRGPWQERLGTAPCVRQGCGRPCPHPAASQTLPQGGTQPCPWPLRARRSCHGNELRRDPQETRVASAAGQRNMSSCLPSGPSLQGSREGRSGQVLTAVLLAASLRSRSWNRPRDVKFYTSSQETVCIMQS